MLTRQITPAAAIASGAAAVDGDASALPALFGLFAFPTLEVGATPPA